MWRTSRVSLLALVVAVGCGDDPGGEGEPPGVDGAAVVTRALAFAEGDLVRVTRDAFETIHMESSAHVWVSGDVLDRFLAIVPGETTDGPPFPEGALLVKQQFSLDGGEERGITLMYKGPPDYGEESDGWFWAQVNAEGRVTFDGQVIFCIGCHQSAEERDWVFGVPPGNRR